MRALYRASFRIGNSPEAVAPLDSVAATCLDWAFYRPTIQDPPPPATNAASFDEKQVGDNTFIGAMLVENDGEKAWGLRLTHADSEDANLRWITEIGLLQGADGQIDFSCSNLVGNVDGAVAPLRRPATRPRLVRDLLLKFGGRGSRPLSAAPAVLVNESSSLQDFLDFLHDPKRRHPIVMISATNMHDRPVVDPDDVASSLAGLVHVYVARNRYPSLTLREHLPRSL